MGLRSTGLLLLLFACHAKASNQSCSGLRDCSELLEARREERKQLEVQALQLLQSTALHSQKARKAQADLEEASALEQEALKRAASWHTKLANVQAEIRPLEAKENSTLQDLKAAEEALADAKSAKLAALRDEKKESALSMMPAKERCRTDIASCSAGLLTLQVELFLAHLRLHWQFVVALVAIVLGAVLLLLPPWAQAASFGILVLLVLPWLISSAFQDFCRIVSDSPPSQRLLDVAGAVVALLTACLLWFGAEGLRLVLGAGLGVFLGSLVLVALAPSSAMALAVASLVLSLLGLVAGLHRCRATQAFAVAVPGGLLVSSGALLLLALPVGSNAFWDEVVAAMMPWPSPHAGKEVGSFISGWGRVIWLLLLLPSVVHLVGMDEDVEYFPWESIGWKQKKEVEPASDADGSAETEDLEAAEAEPTVEQPEVAPTAEPEVAPPDENKQAEEAAGVGEISRDEAAETAELLSKLAEKLRRLKQALPEDKSHEDM